MKLVSLQHKRGMKFWPFLLKGFCLERSLLRGEKWHAMINSHLLFLGLWAPVR